MTWGCETCFDTKTIDFGGREVGCPDCVDHYLPRNVTVKPREGVGFGVWDATGGPGTGYWYGSAKTRDGADALARRRRGVVKAAITRRANKALTKS